MGVCIGTGFVGHLARDDGRTSRDEAKNQWNRKLLCLMRNYQQSLSVSLTPQARQTGETYPPQFGIGGMVGSIGHGVLTV